MHFVQLTHVFFLVAAISCSLLFFMMSSSRHIDESTLFLILASPLPPFLDTYCLYIYICHPCDVRPYASSQAFVPCPIVEVLWSFSRMIPSILRGGQTTFLSLWWEFYNVVWFWVVFSSIWSTFCFLSSPLVWWCLLLTYPSTCISPSDLTFSGFGISIPSVIWHFLLLIILQGTFFYAKIHPYILTAYIHCLHLDCQLFFIFGKQFDVGHVPLMVNVVLQFSKFVSFCAFPK